LHETLGHGDQEQRVEFLRQRLHAGDFVEAAMIAELIDPLQLRDGPLAAFRELRASAFEAASSELFNDGLLYFAADSLDAARRAFESSLHFIFPGADHDDDIIFYFGRIAELEGDFVSAREYYTRVIEEWGTISNVYGDAVTGLARVGG